MPVAPRATPSTEVELFSLAGHDGHLREVNSAFARLLGLPQAEVDGRSVLELVHPDDIPQIVEGLAALAAGAPEVLMENRFLRPGRPPVHLQWVVRPVPDSDLWWAAGRDITKFREALAHAGELTARLELAIGTAGVCMWDYDVRTLHISWEPQVLGVLGLAAGPAPESFEALAEAVHTDDAASLGAGRVELSRADGTFEAVFRIGAGPALRHLSMRGKVIVHDRRGRAQRAVGILLDVTAEKALEEQMLRMVMSDALTGIPNRRAFDQALRTEVRRCVRQGAPVSVLMVDVDDFKRFNDTFGHLVGDDALCAVARSLAGRVERAGDVLARFGGEEFAIVLPDTGAEGAATFASAVIVAVRSASVRQAPGWQLTVSVGVTTWVPGGESARPVDLLADADRALYQAKAEGKDRFVARRWTVATPDHAALGFGRGGPHRNVIGAIAAPVTRPGGGVGPPVVADPSAHGQPTRAAPLGVVERMVGPT